MLLTPNPYKFTESFILFHEPCKQAWLQQSCVALMGEKNISLNPCSLIFAGAHSLFPF